MTALMPSRTAILALTLLIAGCSGAVRQPTYYSLALAPQIDTARHSVAASCYSGGPAV